MAGGCAFWAGNVNHWRRALPVLAALEREAAEFIAAWDAGTLTDLAAAIGETAP